MRHLEESFRAGFEPRRGAGIRNDCRRTRRFYLSAYRGRSDAHAAAQNRREQTRDKNVLWARRVFRPTKGQPPRKRRSVLVGYAQVEPIHLLD
jgi:hypothetical protein